MIKMDIINIPLGWLLNVFYEITGNYLVALIFFAVIIKVILLPLGIKQHNNSIKQAKLRPKEAAIVKRYQNQKSQAAQQKKNEEIQKLYQSEGYNQLAGCLPLIVQLPIIMCIYNVVRSPLRYLCGLGKETVDAILTKAAEINPAVGKDQIAALNTMRDKFSEFTGIEGVAALEGNLPSFTVFGLDLSQTPKFGIDILIIIPIITFITVFITSKLTKKLSYQSPQMQQQTPDVKLSMTIMDLVLPALSTSITFGVPAVIGVYWIYQNLLSLLQQFIMVKVKPFPKFTEEDYKEAERELNGKKKKQNKINLKKDPDRPRVRSLHHIDDDEYNAKVVDTEKKPEGVKSDFITPVPMKDYSDKPSGKVKD
ncbi:MAG: YidC/Oxa1 family membrane protein insertase [Ruminococcaceae bacterium]|nr:YidC/Oxa1 family membrane protein insertase [Oscillospiraceae bacterium]